MLELRIGCVASGDGVFVGHGVWVREDFMVRERQCGISENAIK